MSLQPLDPGVYRDLVRRALDEDLKDALGGMRDVTTESTVPRIQRARGSFRVNGRCVVAGLDVAFECLRALEPAANCKALRTDGRSCGDGDIVATVDGAARTLLVAERTALNFLQRLSGIATLTRRFVDATSGKITVLDTRKTTPTLRVLEKYAVRAGGATNHRFGLFDAVLIKDNHVALAGGVASAVGKARAKYPDLKVEVEADTLAQVDEALAAGADIILADNMSTADISTAVRKAGGRAKIEISGGVTLDRLPELAATGADFVSVGALTHSVRVFDIGLDIL